MSTYRDALATASAWRLPPLSAAAEARLEAALDRVVDEGITDADAAAARLRELTAGDDEVRLHQQLVGATAAFAEQAIALGATYDAILDRWTPPAGMSFDGLMAAIVARLRLQHGG